MHMAGLDWFNTITALCDYYNSYLQQIYKASLQSKALNYIDSVLIQLI